jgi:hypothetical protein
VGNVQKVIFARKILFYKKTHKLMYLINPFEPITSLQLLCMTFLTILFLQSGLDKVFAYQTNYERMKTHFAKSPLKNMIKMLFPVITLAEVGAGVFSFAGLGVFLLDESTRIGLIGAQLSAACVLMLFVGQRLAKDYAGAVVLTQYFLVCLAAIYLLS